MVSISILITSIKDQIKTLNFLKECPVPYEVIISKKRGLGYARNYAASKAKGKILVFFDDDLKLNPRIWNIILKIKPKTFVMEFGSSKIPSTRCLVIHQKDFVAIGGFSNQIRLSGEDREFCLNAIKNGMKLFRLPRNLIYHVNHPIRAKKNRITALMMLFEQAKVVSTYGAIWRNLEGFKLFFFPLPYAKKNKKLLPGLIFWKLLIRNMMFMFCISFSQKYRN
ncbi:MAG: glycosyltransferase [Candidatus Bathyarchaeota archaeon]|nr:glycosyltransferase [Candidatus Bathyarchaeum sp.]